MKFTRKEIRHLRRYRDTASDLRLYRWLALARSGGVRTSRGLAGMGSDGRGSQQGVPLEVISRQLAEREAADATQAAGGSRGRERPLSALWGRVAAV